VKGAVKMSVASSEEVQKTGRERRLANLKPWKKGQTGNPTGTNHISTLRGLAAKHSPRALARIVELMESDDERVAMAASKEILDRAFGRPGAAEDENGPKGQVTINILKLSDGADNRAPEQLAAPTISTRVVDVS
jgi:hypothetical protein